MTDKHVIIQGIRGVPAQHGGFETFAEHLCLYLIKNGWQVTVYCQEDGGGETYESEWQGVKRVHIPISIKGPASTILFDFKSIKHSLTQKGVFLTLGYGTGIFSFIPRLFGKKNIINMDGIEWKRHKWSLPIKAWLLMNELCACWMGNHLIADHPRIKDHLATRVRRKKVTTIAYGGVEVLDADEDLLARYGLEKNKYAIVIARAEPENSILEIVTAFSIKPRGIKLCVLGNFDSQNNIYHRQVMSVASEEVIFPGAIYDAGIVTALRFFSCFYIHGHQVGGTNPSLVEALGAGNAVLAHDNHFNRQVAADGGIYFDSVESARQSLDRLLEDDDLLNSLKQKSRENFDQNFRWEKILKQYEDLLEEWL